MKRLFWYLGFGALLVLGDRLGGYFFQKNAQQSQFRYARLYAGTAEADILLVGNSRGLTFFEPHIRAASGLRTCNLSYNGLPAELAYTLVADYFDRYPAPRYLLLDVTLADRHNNELVAGMLPFASRSPRLDALVRDSVPTAWWGSRVSWLYRANNEVWQRAMYYRSRTDADWLLDRQIAPALAASTPLDTFPISTHSVLVSHLAATVALAQAKGTQVRLLISPYFPNMVRDWSTLDTFKKSVEQATGLPVHDYRQALPDAADFGDLMHPNQRGAIRYLDLLRRDSIF
jgi:hypothetical protein